MEVVDEGVDFGGCVGGRGEGVYSAEGDSGCGLSAGWRRAAV